jgi:putative glutathione S-transferase
MGGRLAAGAEGRRERPLRPPDLKLPQLDHAGRPPRPHRDRRLQGRGRALSALCRADLPLGAPHPDRPQPERLGRPDPRHRGEPPPQPQGWAFGGHPGAEADPLFGASHLHQIYTRADPGFTGRATVPVLWDMAQGVMVSNESADILRMFDTAFEHLAPSDLRLYPADLAQYIDALNPRIYDALNNGVYKAGFATTQEAHDEAVTGVFAMLDALEGRLTGDYLFGDRLTETDIRTFVTLIRFDAAYHGLFKTNRRRIADYPRLQAYMKRILRLPGVRATVNLAHIKAGYYSIKALNPTGIVPTGPDHVTALLEAVA